MRDAKAFAPVLVANGGEAEATPWVKSKADVDGMLMKKLAELNRLTSRFSVELPGIEPVPGCWSLSRTGTELQNDNSCDSPELTSVDSECAQNVPSQSLDWDSAIALA
jgi:hypothetical protein